MVGPAGEILMRAASFEEDLLMAEIDTATGRLVSPVSCPLGPQTEQDEAMYVKVEKGLLSEVEYVDYLKDFVMLHKGTCDTAFKPLELAIASTAASILVTHSTHNIQLIEST